MTTMNQTVLITGNTYPVKDALKSLGAKWDADAKGWRVPAAKADEARKLVNGGGNTNSLSAEKQANIRRILANQGCNRYGRYVGGRSAFEQRDEDYRW
jgi:hypothetical protein